MNKFDMSKEEYIGYLEAKVTFYEAMMNKSNFRPFLDQTYNRLNNEVNTTNNQYQSKPYSKPKRYNRPYKKHDNTSKEGKNNGLVITDSSLDV